MEVSLSLRLAKPQRTPGPIHGKYRPMNLDNMYSIATYGQTTDSEDAIH